MHFSWKTLRFKCRFITESAPLSALLEPSHGYKQPKNQQTDDTYSRIPPAPDQKRGTSAKRTVFSYLAHLHGNGHVLCTLEQGHKQWNDQGPQIAYAYGIRLQSRFPARPYNQRKPLPLTPDHWNESENQRDSQSKRSDRKFNFLAIGKHPVKTLNHSSIRCC